MAMSGESHSIFVVQQTFARVRRGYDPDQVDRHLELVAEMFRRGPDVELRRELARREATIEQEIEAARMEAEATVEGARLRAAADLAAAESALAAAREEAARILAAASSEGAALREEARRAGEADAHVEATRLRDDASLAAWVVRRPRRRLALSLPAKVGLRGAMPTYKSCRPSAA